MGFVHALNREFGFGLAVRHEKRASLRYRPMSALLLLRYRREIEALNLADMERYAEAKSLWEETKRKAPGS